MEKFEIYLISLTIRKWDLEKKRMAVNTTFVVGDAEFSSNLEMALTSAGEMTEEFLNILKKEAGRKLMNGGNDFGETDIELGDKNYIKQKTGSFFKKITGELNNKGKDGKNRQSGQRAEQNNGAGQIYQATGQARQARMPRMILTTYLDVYPENHDVSALPENIQFFIILNLARKYYEKEQFQKAIHPLRRLVKMKPDFGTGYKWLARSLKKVRKYDEAVRNYENYARVENSLDAKLDLAQSYRKGKMFDKSEEIYRTILNDYPDEKEAKIGIAQIKYARQEEDYLPILDSLYQENSDWMREWMRKEFNFRIYSQSKTLLTPVQASRYLGFDKAFEITQMAFRNEVPSHFNPSRARINFFREELDRWAEVVNRFNLMGHEVVLHPENLNGDAAAVASGSQKGQSAGAKSDEDKPESTRVEEIIRYIRETRARREAMGQVTNKTRRPARKSPTQKKAGQKKRGRPKKEKKTT
ncbi:MAG: tetratricopeptide repeat protein [Calditrichaeota bacterium]|nr:tetratricopeptide repeat protein [Calditrichota bacterium]